MPPENRWAYTPIELDAIMHIKVEALDVIATYEKPFTFHQRATTYDWNSQKDLDKWAENLLVRAGIAECEDRSTPPPPWPCPDHHDDGTPRESWPASQDLPTIDPVDGGRNDR